MKLIRLVGCTILGYCEKRTLLAGIRKMSQQNKSAALDEGQDSWFNRYKRVEVPDNVFQGFSDRFNGVTVDSQTVKIHEVDFAEKLKSRYWNKCQITEFNPVFIVLGSLDYWISNKKRGIWFKVNLQESSWVPYLAKVSGMRLFG